VGALACDRVDAKDRHGTQHVMIEAIVSQVCSHAHDVPLMPIPHSIPSTPLTLADRGKYEPMTTRHDLPLMKNVAARDIPK